MPLTLDRSYDPGKCPRAGLSPGKTEPVFTLGAEERIIARIPSLIAAALLTLATIGCSGTKHVDVRVPPRIDLTQHQTIGVIDFGSTAEGELAQRGAAFEASLLVDFTLLPAKAG